MSYYNDVYLKRLNRYGNNYQARIQGQRERVFEDLLLKSPYRVDFIYNNANRPGLLERYQQDDTKTIQYLLTRLDLDMPNGTILEITDSDLHVQKWMILYLESIQASGYNRYFVIKITHTITWNIDNQFQTTPITSYGYLYGPHSIAIRPFNQNSGDKNTPFFQNNSNYFIIMPTHAKLSVGDYFDITGSDSSGTSYTEGYKVIGLDRQTNPGVQYVTIDPVYKYDKTPAPQRPQGSTDPAYDWFDGNFGGNN